MASNFKRNVLNRRQLRHDRCKEIKEMLSGETGKTIFKYLRFNHFCLQSFSFFSTEGLRGQGQLHAQELHCPANKIASLVP